MSLINDLLPEIRELLEADKEQYPNLYKGIMRELNSALMTQDISVGTARTLINYGDTAGVKWEFDEFVNKLYNVFGR